MLGPVLQTLALLLEVGFRNLGLAGWILGRGVLGVVRDIPVSFFLVFSFFFFYILVAVKNAQYFRDMFWCSLSDVEWSG